MQTEFTQDEADALTPEHCTSIGGLIENFMRIEGVKFGYTVLIMERNGIKTMGNMPPEAQAELFSVVALKMAGDGPDSIEEMRVTMPRAPDTH